MNQEFDQFSDDYEDIMNKAMKSAQFDLSYLCAYKMAKISCVLPTFKHKKISFLDFGCGTGNMVSSVQKFFPQGQYIGVDVSYEMIKKASDQFAPSGKFYEYSAPHWKEDRYDIIFSSCVFHHIPPKKQLTLLFELKNLLTDQGKIIIWEHNPYNPITRKIVRECVLDQNAILIYPRSLKKAFRSAQIKMVKLEYATFFPKFLQFLNPLETFISRIPLGAQYFMIGEKA